VQARIVALNAHNFLKNGGHFVISIKVCSFSFFDFTRKGVATVVNHQLPMLLGLNCS
jgi:fibrillarin-like rRNA methylase